MKNNKSSDIFTTKGKHRLLDIIIKARTNETLDRAVGKSKDYQDALEQQNVAFCNMYQAGLSKEQRTIVDRAISATNNCGAVYGIIAYKLGFHDGVRVVSEIKKIS